MPRKPVPSRLSRFHIVYRRPGSLARADRDAIHTFITRFTEYSKEKLDETLDASSHVWLCLDAEDRIIGTTAVRIIPEHLEGRAVNVFYTSAVAVDPAWRGYGFVARMGIRSFLITRMRSPLRPVWWLAMAGSPSGYVQMAHNFTRFWPQEGTQMPAPVKDLLLRLLVTLGRSGYRDEEGCFVLPDDFAVHEEDQGPGRWGRSSRAVDFFMRVNPGYRHGDELACICPIELSPLAAAFLRRTALRSLRPSQGEALRG